MPCAEGQQALRARTLSNLSKNATAKKVNCIATVTMMHSTKPWLPNGQAPESTIDTHLELSP